MLEDKLTALQELESKDDGNQMDVSKSDDSDSEAEIKAESNDEDDGTALAVPKPVDRKFSITLTSSPRPSKTFITDFKSTDPSVVRI